MRRALKLELKELAQQVASSEIRELHTGGKALRGTAAQNGYLDAVDLASLDDPEFPLKTGSEGGRIARMERAVKEANRQRDAAKAEASEALRATEAYEQTARDLQSLMLEHNRLKQELAELHRSLSTSEQIRQQQKELIHMLQSGRFRQVGHDAECLPIPPPLTTSPSVGTRVCSLEDDLISHSSLRKEMDEHFLNVVNSAHARGSKLKSEVEKGLRGRGKKKATCSGTARRRSSRASATSAGAVGSGLADTHHCAAVMGTCSGGKAKHRSKPSHGLMAPTAASIARRASSAGDTMSSRSRLKPSPGSSSSKRLSRSRRKSLS
ncbi:unnamed protein product [Chrysoparadoxa australica]